jgi:hypothetical protein
MIMRNWSAVITLVCLAATAWLTWHGTDTPPSIIALAGVSGSTWFACEAEYKGRRERELAEVEKQAVEAANADEWCEGCDQIRPTKSMAFNSIWLWRCRECRTGEVEVVPGHYRTAAAQAALMLPNVDGCFVTGPPGGPFVVTDEPLDDGIRNWAG